MLKISFPIVKLEKKNEQKNIEDVLDGRLYKAHFADDGYFKGTEDSKKKG